MKVFALCLSLLFSQSFAFAADLAGSITVDGSSTVGPISEAVGEDFQMENPKVRVAVAISGTGAGFSRFCKGEIDIADASRPISSSEITECKNNKIAYVEIPVAYDGIAVVVNKQNTWAKNLTTAELKKIWEPGSKINNWKDIRTGFPDIPLILYGPGHVSGTFDYFTETIIGKGKDKSKLSRSDYTGSENDNTLVRGVEGNKGALGYFGFAYYVKNKDKLNIVAIDAGKGPVDPTHESILAGTYSPLSRPIYIYVSAALLNRPYIKNAGKLSEDVGYVAVKESMYQEALNKIQKR